MQSLAASLTSAVQSVLGGVVSGGVDAVNTLLSQLDTQLGNILNDVQSLEGAIGQLAADDIAFKLGVINGIEL